MRPFFRSFYRSKPNAFSTRARVCSILLFSSMQITEKTKFRNRSYLSCEIDPHQAIPKVIHAHSGIISLLFYYS